MIEHDRSQGPAWPLALRAIRRADSWLTAVERMWSRRRKQRDGEAITVLVRIRWRLGDEIMALPVLQALHRGGPAKRLAVELRYPELVIGNPHVSVVNPLSICPDHVLDLKGEVPGEPRRVTLGRRIGVSLDAIVPRVYLSERERLQPAVPELDRFLGPRIALHAGATQSCKGWSRERWYEVVAALRGDAVTTIQVGHPSEPDLRADLDLRGRTDLRTLARVLAQVDLVVGEDSGPLHLALAVDTPVVGLFGATDPTLLYPPAAPLVPVVAPSNCRFCWPTRTLAYPSGVCPLAQHECMLSITTREVMTAIARQLDRLGSVARSERRA